MKRCGAVRLVRYHQRGLMNRAARLVTRWFRGCVSHIVDSVMVDVESEQQWAEFLQGENAKLGKEAKSLASRAANEIHQEKEMRRDLQAKLAVASQVPQCSPPAAREELQLVGHRDQDSDMFERQMVSNQRSEMMAQMSEELMRERERVLTMQGRVGSLSSCMAEVTRLSDFTSPIPERQACSTSRVSAQVDLLSHTQLARLEEATFSWGLDAQISQDKFEILMSKILQIKDATPQIAQVIRQLWKMLCPEHRNTKPALELCCEMACLCMGSSEDKIRSVFRVVGKAKDALLNRDVLTRVLSLFGKGAQEAVSGSRKLVSHLLREDERISANTLLESEAASTVVRYMGQYVVNVKARCNGHSTSVAP
eukprot:TRINITY_DN26741_c0_g1_i2.p1 TRINITY_DN26741_c0_g1~~TRINITY_DN26741_c0_g1_i2.p1  ORF type:complete len:367 (-),score=96.86 TRINITY_DN26741_c0_g1_i2:426-1526(-)